MGFVSETTAGPPVNGAFALLAEFENRQRRNYLVTACRTDGPEKAGLPRRVS